MKLELKQKIPPLTDNLPDALQKVYDDINEILNAVNLVVRNPKEGDGKAGDIRVIEESGSTKGSIIHKMQFKGTEGWQTVSSSFAEQNTYSMPVYNPVHQQYEAADTTDIFTATFTDIGRISLKDNSIDLDKIKVADLIKDADTFANVDTKIMTAAAVKNYVDSSSAGITLTDTAPTSSSDFASSDIILEKDTGKLWWYSATNSKLYSHTFDGSVDLNFNIASFSDSLSSTFFIKAPGQSAGNIQYDLTINNPQSGTFTGTISLSGTTNSSQTGNFPLDFTQANCTGSNPFILNNYDEGGSIPLLHPDQADAWSDGYKTITSEVSVNDGTGAETLSTTVKFYNKKFYGYSTETDTANVVIHSLSGGSGSLVTTSYTLSEQTITTSAADNYIYYCYPSRIAGTPTFKINGFTTAFTSGTHDKVNAGSNGFTEEYKVWKSPQFYNNATLTLEVI